MARNTDERREPYHLEYSVDLWFIASILAIDTSMYLKKQAEALQKMRMRIEEDQNLGKYKLRTIK